ncbi:MAG: excinuclease ABC subunit UvrA [Micrococcus sp.]|nr:excinuclease ABC subunit UvrA [Micrococcus sp.]
MRVVGARQNNLREVDVTLPKRRLTVFTGVSGSGKSSLVFGTIAAEAQRMINETYPAFVQGFMPALPRPDVDHLEGLTPAIVVDQERLVGSVRSTVGTVTDANALLRLLFAKIAEPALDSPKAYSFNVASISGAGAVTLSTGKDAGKRVKRTFAIHGGMCPTCEGTGTSQELDEAELFDASKSLSEGPFTIPGYTADGWAVKKFLESGFFDPDKPLGEYTEQERHDLLHKEPVKITMQGINMTYTGLFASIDSGFLQKDREAMQPHIRAFVDRAVTTQPCPDCGGTRLNERARGSLIRGKSIADVCAMQITDLAAWCAELDDARVGGLVGSLRQLLDSFVEIGLGYLALDRASGSLSGGEAQRTKMIRHLGSALTDVTYIFDEPTTGLHPHDIDRMNALLLRLRDKGNTVLVVEHKPETIAIADHVVDLGPGPGAKGGEITFTGTVAELTDSDTATGRHLHDRAQLKADDALREGHGALQVRGARRNNLRGVDVDIPLGQLVVITGVAGSGKSSLVQVALEQAGRADQPETIEVVMVDQAGIKGSKRSNPATYTGILEPIRKAFAKAHGVKPSLFSPNSDGACPQCKGAGVVYADAAAASDVAAPCDVCEGRRFQDEVLDYTLDERNISEVLQFSVEEAHEFFAAGEARIPAVATVLGRLQEVGLGYLRLGQPLSALSGGERQRIKLVSHLGERAKAKDGARTVVVLDEPTTGLHLQDVEQMLRMLDGLVDSGVSVIAIEHHQAVMAHGDWIIDVGPGAGDAGGQIVFEGRPAELVAQAGSASSTLTGEHLAASVG